MEWPKGEERGKRQQRALKVQPPAPSPGHREMPVDLPLLQRPKAIAGIGPPHSLWSTAGRGGVHGRTQVPNSCLLLRREHSDWWGTGFKGCQQKLKGTTLNPTSLLLNLQFKTNYALQKTGLHLEAPWRKIKARYTEFKASYRSAYVTRSWDLGTN